MLHVYACHSPWIIMNLFFVIYSTFMRLLSNGQSHLGHMHRGILMSYVKKTGEKNGSE